MNLHHAAALALVGWYLMVPPRNPHPFIKGDYTDTAAPLSKWAHLASSDSAKECEARKSDYLKTVAQVPSLAQAALEAECIASDDPRLKGK
jgi:hypothetical protein